MMPRIAEDVLAAQTEELIRADRGGLRNKMVAERVIFLDIDGVLNCTRTPNPRKFPYIVDPPLVERLTQTLARAGAEIVLSSTWRYDPAGIFSAKHWGIPFVGVTPDMPENPRRDEILTWLKDHQEVRRFAVLDDEDDELDELPLFQPSRHTGLTEKIAQGIVAFLLGETDRDMRSNRLERIAQNVSSIVRGHKG